MSGRSLYANVTGLKMGGGQGSGKMPLAARPYLRGAPQDINATLDADRITYSAPGGKCAPCQYDTYDRDLLYTKQNQSGVARFLSAGAKDVARGGTVETDSNTEDIKSLDLAFLLNYCFLGVAHGDLPHHRALRGGQPNIACQVGGTVGVDNTGDRGVQSHSRLGALPKYMVDPALRPRQGHEKERSTIVPLTLGYGASEDTVNNIVGAQKTTFGETVGKLLQNFNKDDPDLVAALTDKGISTGGDLKKDIARCIVNNWSIGIAFGGNQVSRVLDVSICRC